MKFRAELAAEGRSSRVPPERERVQFAKWVVLLADVALGEASPEGWTWDEE